MIKASLNRRTFMSLSGSALLAGCATPPNAPNPNVGFIEGYGPLFDSGYTLPGVPVEYLQGVNRRITGTYLGEQPVGTVDVDPYAKFLYFVREGANSVRFPIGAGRAGRSFSGGGTIQVKKKWPGWTPTKNMLRTEPEVYGPFARGIRGGLRSPLGARALYLYRGGRDTYYRIHGTNALDSIGNSGSAGCIRMFNHDIIALYEMVPIGTRVHVRSEAESQRVDPENFNRGIELPAHRTDPATIYSDEAIANDPLPDFDAVDSSGNVPL
ncbi:L,D-transpeptidase [Pseudorhodobacter ferrugineus]|uniref:L,D-transpeptidase n=1 Tax=Pseudorhodobacter ferrugineus TaxID=77008 RepID=UPI0004056D22|nr:L,D-transpeptidase [Pseudorhodobacter ferrugineus]